MGREIPNKPHPTPNPDAPHVHGVPREEVDPEEATYDSCLDDLSAVLAEAGSQPDPVLQSPGAADAPRGTAAGSSSALPSAPRTSEVFRTAYPSGLAEGTGGKASGALAADPSIAPAAGLDSEPARRKPKSWHAALLARLRDEHDQASEAGIPWFSLLLLTYASVLTLALTWMFWTGRVSHQDDAGAATSSHVATDLPGKPAESHKNEAVPPLPTENVTDLRQKLRIGNLELEPVGIAVAPAELVRSINPGDWRQESTDSLILTLQLTNVSTDESFAPLERTFVREQASPLDRSLIETADGTRIGLFPLAYDSEWSIQGQEFPLLKPGESAQTVIVSEAGAAERVQDRATWRIRVRVGPYRSDMVGVRFTKADLSR
jgi:hypothetical protein